MIKVENIDAWGFVHAVRGLRNPLQSWDKSDSHWEWVEDPSPINPDDPGMTFVIGENDLNLMRRLYRAGTEHRKYLRQIFASMDITAPLYWWKEMDQYKIGTVTDSCSTMHTIAAKEFELDDFSHEHLFGDFEPIERKSETDYEVIFNTNKILLKSDTVLMCLIEVLNFYRKRYLETKDKKYWWQLIQLLPSSYNQRRTLTMDYENVVSIIRQRTGHKLDEWNAFVDVLKDLPYVKEIMEDMDERRKT